MQDDELDIRIREAASQHHPPYDDKAWEKMEKMLDKHMPLEKDRRRWVFFLLLFLLLGGGLFVAITQPWKHSNEPTLAQNNQTGAPATANTITGTTANSPSGEANNNLPVSSAAPDNNNQPPAASPAAANNSSTGSNSQLPTDAANNKPGSSSPVSGAGNPSNSKVSDSRYTSEYAPAGDNSVPGKNKNSKTGIGSNRTGNPNSFELVNSRKKRKHAPATETAIASAAIENSKALRQYTDKGKTTATITNADATDDDIASNNKETLTKPVTPAEQSTALQPAPAENKQQKEPLAANTDKKKEQTPSTPNNTKDKDKKKRPGGFGNNFGLTVSLGGDMSFISLNKMGKATLLYGAGASYNIGRHVTVRSGFYVSKKIYSATPDQYHNTIYPYLTGIDADCKIYQIPLSVAYSFGQRKNHSWFGNVGLTSLLMKKENYDYNYKNPAGQTYSYYRNIDNENKHYFSVLSVSGGYQYNLNNRFSVTAEPFVNIPLTGVGYGKVKLKSAGVQLSVTFKPFAKKQ